MGIEVWAMKGYSTLPRSLELEVHNQMQISAILGWFFVVVRYSSAENPTDRIGLMSGERKSPDICPILSVGFSAEEYRTTTKNHPSMALICIWLWTSSSSDLGNVEYPFIAHTSIPGYQPTKWKTMPGYQPTKWKTISSAPPPNNWVLS